MTDSDNETRVEEQPQPPDRIYIRPRYAKTLAGQMMDGGIFHYEGGPECVEYVRSDLVQLLFTKPNYPEAIKLLRKLRETGDPEEVTRQRASWDALSADLAQPPSASERCVECVKCHHSVGINKSGICNGYVDGSGGNFLPCLCACVFATTGQTGESILRPLCAEHPHVRFVDGVLGGVQPLIEGHRIGVSHLLGRVAVGMSLAEYKETWGFDDETLQDAFAYAQDVVDALIDRERVATTSRDASAGQREMPSLPFTCTQCGIQQHADGICANCGLDRLVTTDATMFCSCGGAFSVPEYRQHLAMGHDGGFQRDALAVGGRCGECGQLFSNFNHHDGHAPNYHLFQVGDKRCGRCGERIIQRLEAMRQSSLWNANGYDGALSNLLSELRTEQKHESS